MSSSAERTTRPFVLTRTFDAPHAGMEQGWSGTMEQLATYLSELQKG
jgi:hypothetical protein